MKKFIQLLAILLVSSSFLTAQSIDGRVIDAKGKGIFYATVAVHAAQDSSIVKGESTDDEGYFKIDNLEEGNYYLQVSMLGYKDNVGASFSFPNEITPLEITLMDDAAILETVEIVDRVPLLEQKADKMIVNVEGNMTNTSGSLLDVMRKVPGMLVVNDKLSLVGSGNPTILLNGKSTQYMDVESLLKDMPGDNIKKVEIIHQPGAEYEASGSGPIINIIMKKNSLFGTNGSISAAMGRGQVTDYNTGLNLSHYQGNLNINGGLGYARNAYVETIELTRRLSGIGSNIDGNYNQISEDIARPRTYRANLRMDWDMTQRHRLGFETKYYNNDNNYTATNNTTVDLISEATADYKLDTDNVKDRGWQYTMLNPYYIFEIDTAGQKLELDLNTAMYNVQSMNTLITNSSLGGEEQQQRYNQPGETKIFASSVDYTKPVNKSITYKLGAKYSKADLDNDLQSTYWAEGQWKNNEQQSNHYLFDETIFATYGKVEWSHDAWSGTVGLRYEDSESIGESITLDSTLTRRIQKLFPSFAVSREIGSGLKGTVSYSYRIDRPRYYTLNPFVYYLDPFTYEQGNQNLRPQLTHSGKFTLSMDGQPFFNVEYKKSNDAIVEVTEQDPNSQEARKTDINFDSRDQFSASLFFPLEFIPGLNGYGGTIVTKTDFNSVYSDAVFNRSKWNTTLFIQAEFTLPGDINAELGGWYTSANQEGIFNSEWLYGTSFGMSKKFLDNKMKVSVGVEDFANRFWHANVDYQQDMDLIVKWQAPTINARVSYKFGNQHLKSKKKSKTSASEELRRASQN